MENAPLDQEGLQNLALIYLALAHSTDQELEDVEVDAIAEHLRSWQSASTRTLVGTIKDALDLYVREDADVRVRTAVKAMHDRLPVERRQAILNDLMDIAIADGKFLYEESSFINDLAHAWDVHLPERPGERSMWSILGPPGDEDDWTPLHDLALIYLTLAHQTDEKLAPGEVDAITKKLHEWLPEAEDAVVRQLVREALEVYSQGPDKHLFTEAVTSLKQAVPPHQRKALLADLRYIAHADGRVLKSEQDLIASLARAWDLPASS